MKPVVLLFACLGSMLITLTLAKPDCRNISAQSKLCSLVLYASSLEFELSMVQGKLEGCNRFVKNLIKEAQKDGLIPETENGVEGAKTIAGMLENRAKCLRPSSPSDASSTQSVASLAWNCINLIDLPIGDLSIDNKADNTKTEADVKAETGVEAETIMNMRLQAYERENENLKARAQALGNQLRTTIQALSNQLDDAARTIVDRDETIKKLRSELGQSEAKLNSIVDTNNGNVGGLNNCLATLDELKESMTESVGLFETKIGELRQKLTANWRPPT